MLSNTSRRIENMSWNIILCYETNLKRLACFEISQNMSRIIEMC
jgi:hypothetical protein